MKYVLFCVSVGINIVLAAFLINFSPKALESGVSQASDLSQQYPYISRRVFAGHQYHLLTNFVVLRSALNEILATKDNVGLYFEYLPSGTSIGIHENQEFIQASLLKIPLAMAVLKQVESGRIGTGDQIEIAEQDIDPNFGELYKQGVGTRLTVSVALEKILAESDNTARNLLFKLVSQQQIVDVYDYLGIPKDFGEEPTISPKNYSSILRSLYFSSFINPTNSNSVLDLLSRSEFSDMIVAGVPKDLTVAHKIGVRKGKPGVSDVFTDCGIFYLPQRPYLLCMMINSSEAEADVTMKGISTIVYDYVSKLPTP